MSCSNGQENVKDKETKIIVKVERQDLENVEDAAF
jgi:PBP1b-binding outer membrane lipoprotein LpoB